MKAIKVRAFYRAVAVSGYSAPHDTIVLKVYYPCRGDGAAGCVGDFVPADEGRAPFPVAALLPAVNLSHEAYGWLARMLVETGFAVVTYSWLNQDLGGAAALGPGVRLKALRPKRYGKKPSCPALPVVFAELKKLQKKKGALAGLLDLNSVVLGGHAIGGAMALLNANPDWFPQLRGAFAYGAHTGPNAALGLKGNRILPLSRDLPLLMMGGDRDGVLAAADPRKGGGSPTELVERTFREGISGERGDRHLLIIRGANHFLPVWPQDTATGPSFLDREAEGNEKKMRGHLARVVVNFCDHACTGDAMSAADLQGLVNPDHPLAAVAERK